MVHEVAMADAPSAYHEALWVMRSSGVREDTRNGEAWVLPHPFVLTLYYPNRRVIACPVRNANPFFHVMETVWMFAGQKNIKWMLQFNKNFDQFAESDSTMRGAYGYRWLHQWGNQIRQVIELLRVYPHSRRAVLTMWDPISDINEGWKDVPCNTHIYFRVRKNFLDMTVCNRSNDLVWGMFGSNIVHMTYLHEFIAIATGHELGNYQVFTNNLHFYRDVYPNGKEILSNLVEGPVYSDNFKGYPILASRSEAYGFLKDCALFVKGDFDAIASPWLLDVAKPMHDAYLDKEARLEHISQITASDWRANCYSWAMRALAREKDQPHTSLAGRQEGP